MHLKHAKCFLLIVLLACSMAGQSQGTVTGKILDENGLPLPFATVYEEGTTNGTTSNANGVYQLSLSPGPHSIVAQYIGYGRGVQKVEIRSAGSTTLNFSLQPETLVLREVIISANERDPARSIIRNAIRKRRFYANEVNAYACDVYIKGLQRLDKRPDKILGITITVDTGIVYLSESISKLKFEMPDKINETMISSRVSGNNNAFSYNQASDMLINLYQNTFFIEGLSERAFISPISNNAFFYYDYKMAGTVMEDTLMINKIRILPKRKTDPVFSGYIYIIEGSWRIHSVDVSLTKANGINFIDSLGFKQIFAPVEHDIWMPINQRFTFKFKTFGFEGSGHFTGIYRNYELEPNYGLFREEEKYTQVFEDDHQEKDLFEKKEFTKAVMTVKEGANEKDSIYWKDVRPIPLTELEVTDYRIKDSVRVIKESKPYKDSIDSVRNRFKPGNLIFNGYTYYNSYQKRYINFPTLFQGLQYNSVEGAVANLEFSIQKRDEERLDYRLSPSIRYGFANQRLQAKLEGFKLTTPKKREFWFAGLGRYVYHFNESEPISPLDNSYFTLVEGRNYAKLYQKTFGYLGYQQEVVNGILVTGRVSYDRRQPMANTTTFNFADRSFSSNHPINSETESTSFPAHEAFLAAFRVRFRIDQKYIDRPDRKILLGSKYPDLFLTFRKGIPLFGSDVNYDLLKAGATHEIRLGLTGTSQFSVWAGAFLNSREVYFQDFEHFNGNQTIIRQLEGENFFQLLEYYQFSTKDKYLEVHYEHHFNEFIFNKIPYVKHLNLQAVGSMNYLTTPTLGQYIELGAGVEHIFTFFRADFFTSLQNGSYAGSGIRIGAGF